MEILNIDYNIKRLVIKSLNNSRLVKQASIKLGCSVRQLNRYMNMYNIKFNKETLYYEEDISRGSITAEVRGDENDGGEF